MSQFAVTGVWPQWREPVPWLTLMPPPLARHLPFPHSEPPQYPANALVHRPMLLGYIMCEHMKVCNRCPLGMGWASTPCSSMPMGAGHSGVVALVVVVSSCLD